MKSGAQSRKTFSRFTLTPTLAARPWRNTVSSMPHQCRAHHAVDHGEDCMDALHRIGKCSFFASVVSEMTWTPARRRVRVRLRFYLRIGRAAAGPELAQPAGAVDHDVHTVVPVGRVGYGQAADIGESLLKPDHPERTTLLSCPYRRRPAKFASYRRLYRRNLSASQAIRYMAFIAELNSLPSHHAWQR